MTDWQKGDLALCVKTSTCGRTRSGAVYTVAEIIPARFCNWNKGGCSIALRLEGVNHRNPCGGSHPHRFRKITPPAADEFDREVIELMTGKPARVPTAQFDRLLKAAAKELLAREWRATGKDER